MNSNSHPDFNNLLKICSLNFSKKQIKEIDWDKLIYISQYHRVSGILVNNILKYHVEIPEKAKRKLKESNRTTKLRMLKFSAEIVQLSKCFSGENIDLIFLKGPVAAKQIYDDFTAKNSRDIDLLIHEKYIDQTITLLQNNSYESTYPYQKLNIKQKKYFRKVNNQLVFFNKEKKIQLEVHWRLFQNPYLLPISFETLLKNAETLEIAEQNILGLGEVHLLIYHCAHGAKHQWEKLYWLLEIIYLLQKKPKLLKSTLESAEKMNILRPLLQALYLSNTLLNTNYKINQRYLTKNSNEVNELVEASLKSMLSENVKTNKFILKTFLKKLRYTQKLKKSFKFKLAQGKLLSVNDFIVFPLPSYFFGLYYPLRPFIFVWRKFLVIK